MATARVVGMKVNDTAEHPGVGGLRLKSMVMLTTEQDIPHG